MDRQEDCRLIAEFLGWNKSLGITYFKDKRITTAKHFDFVANGDWNGLMEVVEKIEKLGNDVVITTNYIQIAFDEGEQFITTEEVNVKIQAVYSAVLKFIKWYNNQTN
jgi:hypothetical protein